MRIRIRIRNPGLYLKSNGGMNLPVLGIRTSDKGIRMRIREAQKHTDPDPGPDADSEDWYIYIIIFPRFITLTLKNMLLVFIVYKKPDKKAHEVQNIRTNN